MSKHLANDLRSESHIRFQLIEEHYFIVIRSSFKNLGTDFPNMQRPPGRIRFDSVRIEALKVNFEMYPGLNLASMQYSSPLLQINILAV